MPSLRLGEISLLSESDRRRVVHDWNQTDHPFPTEVCLQDLIAQQTALTPDSIAVSFVGQTLTYRELDERSARLARRLAALGVGVEDRVAICVRRSFEMIVGLLGILRSGAAYVPLDPDYPADRLAFILGDASPAALLTTREVTDRLPGFDGPRLDLEADEAEISTDRPSRPISVASTPQNIAYVIYTSGSTGRPKGAANSHRAVVNRLDWMQRHFAVGPKDRILHKTPFSFDVSVWELFLPLLCGARLVLAPPSAHRDTTELAELIRREGVTLLHFVPSLLDLFLETEGLASATSTVRAVIASGEALPLAVQQRFFAKLACELHNLYGPTEAAIDVTAWQCRPEAHGNSVPIGRPISNVRTYVLDPALQPVPVGVSGELYLGGVALARGYHGRPELTAERFVPAPYAETPGQRFYRTGDLVRHRPTGDIEFLGRIDNQVKLRGYRIELGEIEAVIAEHPAVRQAVVDCRTDDQGNKRLIAWFVPASHEEGNADIALALRQHCAAKLPEYMIPSALVPLGQVPLNPSGKIDRRALPEPNFGTGSASYEAPRNPIEQALAEIWTELLPVERVGVRDNFFAIGGDSIISIQAVARARKRGIVLEVNEIFRSPTIAELAEIAAARVPAVKAASPVAALPATPVEEALVAWSERTGKSPWRAIRLRATERLSPAPLSRALAAVGDRHETLRRVFRRDDAGRLWREIMAPGEVRPPLARDRDGFETAIEHLATSSPGTGSWGGVLNADDDLLLFAHTAVVDEASWPALVAELESAYRTIFNESAPSLPAELPVPGTDRLPAPDAVLPEGERIELTTESRIAWLGVANRPFRTRPIELLLTALARSLSPAADPSATERASEVLRAEVYVEGRRQTAEPISAPARFATVSLALPAPNPGDRDAVRTIKERFHNAVTKTPEAGVPPPIAVSLLLPCAAISSPGGLFVAEGETFGSDPGAIALPSSALRITAILSPNRAEIRIAGSGAAALAPRLRHDLEALLKACRQPGIFAYSPTDFPLAQLDQEAIDELFGKRPDIEDVYPLAPMQAGLLFRSLYLPGSDSYLNQNVVELTGSIDVPKLRQAWNAVVHHYTILRTAFVYEDAPEPLQCLCYTAEPSWQEHDWRALNEEQRQSAFSRTLQEDRRHPFALDRAPLLRLCWMQLAENRGYLLWSHHHVLLDGWCLSLIWGNVFVAYEQLRSGGEVALAPSRPYRDYIEWLLRQQVRDESETYWKNYLAGFTQVTGFSQTDTHFDGEYHTLALELSAPATADLRRLAQRYRVTLNTFVQAAWSLLLWRYCGRTDVVFGVSVSGRPVELAGVEDMVGLFINTLPLRVALDPDATLSSFLSGLQDNMVRINDHAHVPLARIKSWCAASQGSGKPIFETLIAFENYPEDKLPVGHVAGLEIRDVLAVEKTEYPLGMIVLPENRLIFHLNYDTAHFPGGFVHRLGEQLINLHEGMLRDPDGPMKSFSLLSAQAEREIVAAGDRSAFAAPFEAVHRRFERAAARQPDATAIVDGAGETLTYRNLDAWASAVAGRLATLGVRPEEPVAILADRSPAGVAALLGVLKAGAAYLPLDPGHPEARHLFQLEDSGAKTLLFTASLAERAAALPLPGFKIGEPPPGATPAPGRKVEPDHVAYVIYTSGSTGKPKGVAGTHGGLANRLTWSLTLFSATADDTLLHLAAAGFDIALWEVLFPLASGGRLVLVDDGMRTDPARLAARIEREKVTILHFVPSLFRTVVEVAPNELCRGLRHVACGGEALGEREARRFVEHFAGRLHHWYGPTEAAISVTSHECRPGEEGRPPVGTSIDGATVRVLDSEMRPQPIEVQGEVFLGGIPLARGYLGSPAATAERWLPDPLSGEPGARLYRTGDVGLLRPNGELEIRGRVDQQVKIRGVRVEPGEVESALRECPEVVEAAVVAHAVRGDERELVAFVRFRADRDGHTADLAARLRLLLPDAAVPTRIFAVDEIPTLANGKVDRLSLQRPIEMEPPQIERIAPRNEIEARLAEIWRNLLGVGVVGVNESFFDLGGHSLLVVSLMHRIGQAFGRERAVNITDIFKRVTIADLARVLEGAVDPRPDTLVEISSNRATPARPPLVLVHPSEGMTFCYRGLAGAFPDRALYAINNPHFGDPKNAFPSVEEMARCYLGYLRNRFPRGPVCIGGWSFGGVVALEMATQLAAADEEVEAVVLIDSFNFSAYDLPQPDPDDAATQLLALRGVGPGTAGSEEIRFEIAHSGRLASRYRPSHFPGRVVLLRASDRDPGDALARDPFHGWRKVLAREPEVGVLTGRHEELFDPDRIGSLVNQLGKALGEEPGRHV